MIISHAKQFAFFRIPKTGSTTAEFMLRQSGGLDESEIIATVGFGGLPSSVNLPDKYTDNVVRGAARRRLLRRGEEGLDIIPINFNDPDGFLGANVMHMTPTEAIGEGLITLAQLRTYDCYAYLRDPRDRYVSSYAMAMGPGLALPERLKATLTDGYKFGLVGKNQVDFFFVDGEQVLAPLDFTNYVSELRGIITFIGGFDFPFIPTFNTGRARDKNITLNDWFVPGAEREIRALYREDFTFYEENRNIWDA